LLAAPRSNAQHPTGPRTATGKQASKFNGLQRGGYAALRHHREAMLRLGEVPGQFGLFKQELTAALGPDTALSAAQIEYVARKSWRRERLALEKRRRALIASWPDEKAQSQGEMPGVVFAAA